MSADTAAPGFWDQLTFAAERLTTGTAVPPAMLLLAALVLGVAMICWRPVRRLPDLLVTVAHEAGHATAAVLTGRKVTRVHVRGDGSGTTHTLGTPGGLGSFFVSFAGYPFPAAVGALLIAAATSGVARGSATVLALALVVLLLRMRNAIGWLIVALAVTAVAAAAWFVSGPWLAAGMIALGTALIVGAVQSLLQERRSRRRGGKGSDVAHLAARGRFRAPVYWTAMFAVVLGFGAGAAHQISEVYPPPW
jgi:hypothetical protein